MLEYEKIKEDRVLYGFVFNKKGMNKPNPCIPWKYIF